jgi:hypothetical protein
MKLRPDVEAKIEGSNKEINAAHNNVAPLDAFKLHGDNLWQRGNHGHSGSVSRSFTPPDANDIVTLNAFKLHHGGKQ